MMPKDGMKGYIWFHLYDILKTIKLLWWRRFSCHPEAEVGKGCDYKGREHEEVCWDDRIVLQPDDGDGYTNLFTY